MNLRSALAVAAVLLLALNADARGAVTTHDLEQRVGIDPHVGGQVPLGALFRDEHLGANHFLGMACIGLGLAAIDARMLRALRPRSA